MECDVTLVLGPPGTGKTTYLLDKVEQALAGGLSPESIGYFSFTKKAADEAIQRACKNFDMDEERFPHFRTLHSFAFRMLELQSTEVMTDAHYNAIGVALGIVFTQRHSEEEDNAEYDANCHLGDTCLRIDSLARLGGHDLKEQWRKEGDASVPFNAVEQFSKTLLKYKSENGMYDFTDMIEKFDFDHKFKLCIVDEVQDLSAIQHHMVEKLKNSSEKMFMAGDDDQAIFNWAGADVDKFLGISAERIVLPQSFRVPETIHQFANKIISKVRNRHEKTWKPRFEKGAIEYVSDETAIDYSSEDTWMLLSRSKRGMYRFVLAIRQSNRAFVMNNKSSLDTEYTAAIKAWKALSTSKGINPKDARRILRFAGAQKDFEKKKEYFSNDFDLKYDSWEEDLPLFPAEEKAYIKGCLRNGDRFDKEPSIVISTIHQSKGGEADNVVLLTDIPKKVFDQRDSEAESRVWYVAVTRARKKLFVVQAKTPTFYELFC